MSLNFIHDFQRKIHSVLSKNHKIRNQIQNIYLSVVQDGKYPFLLINVQKASDLSRYEEFIFEVDFEICAFSRSHKQSFLLPLANEISACLIPKECKFEQYLVAGLKLIDVNFQKAGDLLSNKLTMNYKALIKRI